MKVRVGFVSNSSSSSFVCEVCGADECGYDISLRDAEMEECENRHTFCIEHELKHNDVTLREIITRKLVQYQYHTKEECDAMSFEDLKDEWNDRDDANYDIPMEFCPICNFQAFIGEELKDYVLMKNGLTEEGLASQIREQYGSYKDFKNAIVEFRKNQKKK
jgi:hypothetical protein